MLQTKFNQIFLSTSSIEEMEGMYLAKNLFRSWKEDFIDEDTGEVVSIERNEIILSRGTYLGPEQLAMISFHMQTKDISTVHVTNQERTAIYLENTSLSPWVVTVSILRESKFKKIKFILMAKNVKQALDVVVDYVEITYKKTEFKVVAIKSFSDHIFLFNNPLNNNLNVAKQEDYDGGVDKSYLSGYAFYSIDAIVRYENDSSPSFVFLVFAKDVDDAKVHISHFLQTRCGDDIQTIMGIEIKSANTIKCETVIPKEWTMAYNPDTVHDEQ